MLTCPICFWNVLIGSVPATSYNHQAMSKDKQRTSSRPKKRGALYEKREKKAASIVDINYLLLVCCWTDKIFKKNLRYVYPRRELKNYSGGKGKVNKDIRLFPPNHQQREVLQMDIDKEMGASRVGGSNVGYFKPLRIQDFCQTRSIHIPLFVTGSPVG